MKVERKKFTPITITLEHLEEYQTLVYALMQLNRYEKNKDASVPLIYTYRPDSSKILNDLLEKLETKNIPEVD